MKIETEQEMGPLFRRKYTGVLDDRAIIEVNIGTPVHADRCSRWSLTFPGQSEIIGGSGFAWPKGGRNPIDENLKKLIVDFVKEAERIDAEFMEKNSKEFVDARGRTWRLV